MAEPDIRVRFGVLGGGSISGESGKIILRELKSIASEITGSHMPRVKVAVNMNETAKMFKQQLQNVVNGINLTATVSTKINTKADPLKLFDTAKLEADGKAYYRASANLIADIKQKFSGQKVDIDLFKDSSGKINGFTTSLKKADTTIEKTRFKLAELTDDVSKFNGFVQAGATTIDKTAGTGLNSALNYWTSVENKLLNLTSRTTQSGAKPLLVGMPELEQYNTKLQEVTSYIDQIKSSTTALSDEHKRKVNSMVSDMQRYAKELQAAAYAGTDLKAQTFAAKKEQLQAGLGNQIKVWTNAGIFGGDFEQNVTKAKALLDSATDSTGLDAYLQKYRMLKAEFTSFKIDNSMWDQLAKSNIFDTKLETAQLRIKNLKTEYGSFVNDPSLMKQWRGLFDQSQIVNSEKELTNLNASIDQFEQKLISVGKHGPSMFAQMAQTIQKMASWMVIGNITASMIRGIKGIYTSVVDLDTAMIELKKVTDEASSAYNMFLDDAPKRAVKLGTSITDLTNATADFARLGDHSIKESELLAERAIVYEKVGDQINGVSGATSSIITAMKAFDVAAKDSMSIVDKYNEVGNNFAISSGGIGEAMQRSAASLAEANNTIDESIALIVAANNVTQDPDVVGTAWKTVAMRIRGAKAELEQAGLETDGMVESASKLRDVVMGLTNVNGLGGVDILADDKTFKSTYQIMLDISKVWEKMSDIDQAALLELLAGKRQGNVVAGALKNMDDAAKALTTSLNSEGSAMAEHAKWMESIEAKQEQFKAQYEDFANSILSSDLVKGTFDAGTGILGFLTALIDKLGAVPPLVSALYGLRSAATGKGFFKIDANKDWFGTGKGITTAFSSNRQSTADFEAQLEADVQALTKWEKIVKKGTVSIESFKEAMAGASTQAKTYAVDTRGAAKSAEAYRAQQVAAANATKTMGLSAKIASAGVTVLNVAMNMLISMGVALAIQAVIAGFDALVNSASKASEKADEFAQKQRELSDEANETVSSLDELIDRYEKLRSGDGVRILKKDSLTELEKANSEFAVLKQRMEDDFTQGNVDLTLRPQVEIEDGTYETVLSSFETFTENGKTFAIHYTPILDTGEKLSDTEINEYIRKCFSSGNALEYDNKSNGGLGVILRVQAKLDTQTTDSFVEFEDQWGESLHKIQAKYYDTIRALQDETLYQNTLDADARTEIRGIQEDIVSLVGGQADNLDLVNNRLDEELAKLKAIRAHAAEDAQNAAVGSYHAARESANSAVGGDRFLLFDGWDYVGKRDRAAQDILAEMKNNAGGDLFRQGINADAMIKTAGTAEERVEQLRAAMAALKEEAEYDYANSDLYSGLSAAVAHYEEYIKSVKEASSTLVDSTIILAARNQDLSGSVVNSTASYEQYRQAIINAAIADAALSAAMADGEISTEDITAAVDDLMARDLPEWYNKTVNPDSGGKSGSKNGIAFESISEALKAAKTARDTYKQIQDDVDSSIDGTISLNTLNSLLGTYADLSDTVSDYLSGAIDEKDLLDILEGKYTNAAQAAGYNRSMVDELGDSTDELTRRLIALSDLESKFGSLSSALGEFSENGIVGAGTLSQLQTLFQKIDGFDAFVSVLGDSKSTMDEVRVSANTLAEAYIRSTGILDSLTEETSAMTIAELSAIGVTNAAEIVTGRLSAARYEAILSTEGLTTATWTVVESFLHESGASAQTIAALQALRQEQYNAKLAAADFTEAGSDIISSLLTQAQSAGVAANSISALSKALALKEKYESRKANMYEFNHYEELMDGYAREAQADLSDITITLPEVKIPIGKKSGSGSKSVEAYIVQIDRLRESVKKLDDVQNEIATTEAKLNLLEDTNYDARIQYNQRLAELTDKENSLLHEQVELRRALIQENVDKLRRYGFDVTYDAKKNDFYVNNLELINTLTHGNVKETNEYKKSIEDLISTTESMNEDNIDSSLTWFKNAAAAKTYRKELMSIRQEQADEWIDINEHQILLWDNQGGQDLKIIASYQQMMGYLHSLANEYRANGYREDSKEIRALQEQWWQLHKKKLDLQNELNQKRLAALEKEREAQEELLNLTKELVKQEANDHIDDLEKSRDVYREIVDLKIKSLELTERERSYEENVKTQTNDLAKLQARADMLKLDDSREGKLEYNKLLDEIAKKDKELADTQHDYSIENQKDALETEYDLYSKSIDNKIDAIKDFLNDNERLTNEAMQRINIQGSKLYDDLLIYAKKYTNTSEADISSMWGTAIRKAKEYQDFLSSMKSTQDAIDYLNGTNTNVVDNMKQNSQNWSSGQDGLISDNDNRGTSIGAEKDQFGYWWKDGELLYGTNYYSDDERKALLQKYSAAWKTISDKELQKEYADRGYYLGTSAGATRDSNGVWWKNGKRWFHHGGVVGGRSTTTQSQKDLLAWLQPDEIVLTKQMQNNALALLQEHIPKVQLPLQNFQIGMQMQKYLNPAMVTGQEIGDVHIEFNVAGSMDESLISKCEKMIRTALNDSIRSQHR